MFSRLGRAFVSGTEVRMLSMRAAVAPALLVLLALAASCEFPFSLRDSELPTGSSTQIIPATEPGALLSTLINSIENRDASSYGAQLAADFIFVADQIDVAALEQYYPGVFSNWDVTVERDVTNYMLDNARCTLGLLSFADQAEIENTATIYTVQLSYQLNLKLVGVLQGYSGQARIFMRKAVDDNLWHIYRWEDIKLQDAQRDTWGLIRGRIRATK